LFSFELFEVLLQAFCEEPKTKVEFSANSRHHPLSKIKTLLSFGIFEAVFFKRLFFPQSS